MKQLLVTTTVILFFSFAGKTQLVNHGNIKFDFQIEKLPATRHSSKNFKVTGTLYNPNKDTVYFLATSCNGIVYCLEYDTAAFIAEPGIYCNASWPIVEKIPPNAKHDFLFYVNVLVITNQLKLGFNFYEVGSSFNVNDPKLSLGDAYRINRDHKNIIWAEIKKLE